MKSIAEILKECGIGGSFYSKCPKEKIPFFRFATQIGCRNTNERLNPDENEDDKRFIEGIADHSIQRGFSNTCLNCRGNGDKKIIRISSFMKTEVLETHHQ